MVEQLTTKLIRRHPHVFADVKVGGAADVEVNWEALKKAEKGERVSALDGVPRSLPALAMAAELQKRMRKTGFEWPDRAGAEAKLAEELAELREAADAGGGRRRAWRRAVRADGAGDWYGANAEDALRGTNAKVEARFRYVEDRVRERGLSVSDLPLAELVAIWQQAKSLDRQPRVTEPSGASTARKRQASVAAGAAGRRRIAWRPSTRRCSPGTGGSGATCRGAGPAIRTRSWSRRSCSSRPRWTG